MGVSFTVGASSYSGAAMAHETSPHRPPIVSRAELDFELARVKLRLDRLTSHVLFSPPLPGDSPDRAHALAEWFVEISDGVFGRSPPGLRAYARERMELMQMQNPVLSTAGARRREPEERAGYRAIGTAAPGLNPAPRGQA